jgi:membrane protease YdiL (CAAX protease family)
MGPNGIVLWTWLLIAVLVLALWFALPGLRRWLLPPQRHRAVPWTGFELLFALLLARVWPQILLGLLVHTGVFAWLYGPDFVAALRSVDPDTLGPALERATPWLTDLSVVSVILSVVVVLRAGSDTRPYQLGLTLHRAGRNLLLGVLAWVAVTPFAYVVLALATWVSKLLSANPDEHLLTKLSHAELSPLEWFLLVFSAVVAAPVVEELLFRGLVQPWLARRPWGGVVGLAAALLMPLTLQGFRITTVVFVLLLVPPFLLVWRQGRSPVAGAVFGTSLFWAMMHANVWPTPVPLFVLGLVLGFLAYRTQSLVAPLVLHALFNGVGCLILLNSHVAPPPVPVPEKGSAATTAARRPAAASTSTAVPGSWLPRRRYASAIGPNRGDTTEEATWPTSSPPRSTRAADGTAPSPETCRPSSVRLTWPRSRAMTIGSWPR